MPRFGQVIVIGALLALGLGARLNAQTQLIDPKDAPKIFATTCSACHKSPSGLAKSGQVAGFLRQHYTTGPEMSAAMAAYLVAAGNGPAGKKGEAKAKEQNENPAAKGRKKQEQAAVQPGDRTGEPRSERSEAKSEPKSDAKNAKDHRTLRGKQLQQAKAHEERAAPHPSAAPAPEPSQPAPAASAPAEAPTQTASTPAAPAAAPAAPAIPAAPPMMTLDIPLPEMPTAPPADLNQSVFSSSPVP